MTADTPELGERAERWARRVERLPFDMTPDDFDGVAATLRDLAAANAALVKERDEACEGMAAAVGAFALCNAQACQAGISWAGKNIVGDKASIAYVRAAVHYYEQMDALRDEWKARLDAALARAERLESESADLKVSVIAFGSVAAVAAARDWNLPANHLLPHHYDILEKAGARMVDFTRAALATEPPK